MGVTLEYGRHLPTRTIYKATNYLLKLPINLSNNRSLTPARSMHFAGTYNRNLTHAIQALAKKMANEGRSFMENCGGRPIIYENTEDLH